MIEKDIRKLLDLVEEKSVTSTKQLNESKASPQDMVEGMPSSVAKHKQQLADMSDKEFAEKYGSKSDEELMAMAWRNGYGKDSKFYVNKKNKGKQGVAEGVAGKQNFKVFYKTGQGFDAGTGDVDIKAANEQEAKKIFNKKYSNWIITKIKQSVKGVAEGSSDDLVYISVDRVEAFEDWMDSEGLETNVPKTDEGTYVVYDYSNADYRSKMYASDWNEKKGVAEGSLKESSIKFGIKKALKEGYWDDIGKAVLDFKGSELPRNYRKLEINSDSPHYKLHADEFKKDVWDQLKDKGVAVAKQIAPAKKVGGVSLTPELLLQVWRKLENVVSNVVPDGDPIDWMAPYLRKMGVDSFYTREILDKAVKRHYDKRSDYSKYLQDMWDAYGEMQGDDYQNPWK